MNGRGTNGHTTTRRIIKSLKAKADAKRTRYEWLADWMTGAFGSVTFLSINIIWFGIWIVWNIGDIPGVAKFDPYPFGLLTMIVSLEAIVLSIFVLISQNRASKVNDLREETDLQIDAISEQELTKVMEIVVMLAQKQGIDLSQDKTLQEMLKPLNTGKIEKALERQV
ncbi:MAG: hypothetical protein A3B30_03580 [Candidatus Komeilibacteria bacterium RIFCSPLOWO2_01_FULL_52_15]|uniref:DUF1003 domain-containing protein n=2 Tax=Candidatus Komeiliibacteriota TaxID=1817908 RepID=A0A1G2BP80_9BACT|nr:MAG: hypothetical protein A2677_02930 [Candidatus Komeilibacteria bacterium RIFCSPHIGHO2_01_FULL_52_14]OGY90945.1 MAG: hypothetical protein A3B30_03580 [Candidatus Komeilibacteria bacterium RIFCSPLOWO2_01_FULL_52_15]